MHILWQSALRPEEMGTVRSETQATPLQYLFGNRRQEGLHGTHAA